MSNLREAVKSIIIDKLDGYNSEEAKYWFENPQEYSCVNGCISDLIYYSDTEPFAREHHDEIVELMKEYGAEPMSANDMAWFGFEATVPTLQDEVMEELFLNEAECEELEEKISEILGEAQSEKDGNNDAELKAILENVKSRMGL